MNKRFSTLMVAFMAIGSVLSSAMAQGGGAVKGDDAGRLVEKAKDLKAGRAYYVATVVTTGQVAASTDYFMGMTLGSAAGDDKEIVTASAQIVGIDATLPSGLTSNQIWIVEKDGGNIAFKNAETGIYLAFDKETGVIATTVGNAKKGAKWFLPDNAGLKLQDAGTTSGYLKIADNAITTDGTDNSNPVINFYEARNEGVDLADLQLAVGNDFSLNIADAPKGDSIFAKVTAVEVAQGSNTNYSTDLSTADEAFYLMVEGKPNEANKFNLTGSNNAVKAFDDAKFIVLTTNRLSGEFENAANGYRYAVMTGKDLNKAVKTDKTINAANAMFTAATSYNQDGYILTQKKVKVSADLAAATVWVDKVKEGSIDYVASRIVDFHKSPVVIEAGKGTAVVVKDLVKGKMVVNVLVEKDPTKRNFVEALGLADADGSVAVTTTGKVAANLAYPAGQWLVSVADGNKIDLINLQDPSKKETGLSLYATDNAGEYTVKGGTALSDKTIKLVNIANPNLYNGYLNLDDKDLAGKTFKLSAKATLVGLDIVAYLKANTPSDGNVGVTQLEDEATEWALEKMVGEKDTLKIITTYKSYDAEGALKEYEDEVIGIAFGYKLTAVGAAAANSELANWGLGDADSDAGKTIMFKQVAAGKYAMVGGSNDVDNDDMNTLTNYATIGSDNGKLTAASSKFSNASQFTLTEVDPAPSYKATAQHATFKVNGINYIAMDKNFNGVVANETSDLKAATMEDFTFWIDSVNSDAVTPNFFISKGGMMMCDAQFVIDTIQAAKDNYDITTEEATAMTAACKVNDINRVKFVAAERWANSDSLIIAGDTANVKAFIFSIVEDGNGNYLLKNGSNYVSQINSQLVLTTKDLATPVEVNAAEAPVSNEAISTSTVKVIAGNGDIRILGAQGKKVVVSNVLGQSVANTVISSDDATISAPAGIVVVNVEGEAAVKALVK